MGGSRPRRRIPFWKDTKFPLRPAAATSVAAESNLRARLRISESLARRRLRLDIGASTGGFTDCLLQHGARKVFAVDVGHGQLAWKIRDDPRVITLEKTNARHLSRAEIPEPIDICVIDVSFISLTLILPNAFELLTPDGVILALIKPQFELAREDVGRGGIVRSTELHEKAQQKVAALCGSHGRKGGGPGPLQHHRYRRQPGILHMSPKTIGLIAHTGKPGAAELVRQLQSEFERAGLNVRVETETAALIGAKDGRTIAQLGAEADLLVVLGGDGTILNVVSGLEKVTKPIFGINIGSLGFLTCLNSSAYRDAVSSIVSGKFALSERVLLSVEIMKAGKRTSGDGRA